jgi:hypothetical protein
MSDDNVDLGGFDANGEEKDPGWSFKVAGVSFSNDEDGSSRQEILEQLRVHQNVELRLEPENKYDENAIAVWSHKGKIGYVPAKINVALKEWLDDHERVRCVITNLGRAKEVGLLGCRVKVVEDA